MTYTPSLEHLRKMFLLKFPQDQREERGEEFDRMVHQLQAATLRDTVAHFQQNVSFDDFLEHAGFHKDTWDTIQNAWISQDFYMQWLHHHANTIEDNYPENTVIASKNEQLKDSLTAVLAAHGYPASLVGNVMHTLNAWDGETS